MCAAVSKKPQGLSSGATPQCRRRQKSGSSPRGSGRLWCSWAEEDGCGRAAEGGACGCEYQSSLRDSLSGDTPARWRLPLHHLPCGSRPAVACHQGYPMTFRGNPKPAGWACKATSRTSSPRVPLRGGAWSGSPARASSSQASPQISLHDSCLSHERFLRCFRSQMVQLTVLRGILCAQRSRSRSKYILMRSPD